MNQPAANLPNLAPTQSSKSDSSPKLGAEEPSLLPGVNCLIEGPTGTGKTYAIGTLADTGIETFYLSLESGMESLLGYWTDRGLHVPKNLHWHHLKTSDYSFTQMLSIAENVSRFTNEALTKMADPNKSQHNQFIKLLQVLNNFEDQRTGQRFGPVDQWGPDKALVIDALTGVNTAALSLVVGAKPIKSMVDWGIAMDAIERLLRQLTEGCRCHFILLSHVERETDQILGGIKLTVGTLGQKLAPKIPPMFSDVILSYRNGKEFFWSTANAQADLKTRNLEIKDGIAPDFKLILDKWISRGGRLSSTVKI
jgi:hypothetical protein